MFPQVPSHGRPDWRQSTSGRQVVVIDKLLQNRGKVRGDNQDESVALHEILELADRYRKASATRLANAYPLLRMLFAEAAKRTDIAILDSQLGRAAQELSYRTKRSKARFGQSAHN